MSVRLIHVICDRNLMLSYRWRGKRCQYDPGGRHWNRNLRTGRDAGSDGLGLCHLALHVPAAPPTGAWTLVLLSSRPILFFHVLQKFGTSAISSLDILNLGISLIFWKIILGLNAVFFYYDFFFFINHMNFFHVFTCINSKWKKNYTNLTF